MTLFVCIQCSLSGLMAGLQVEAALISSDYVDNIMIHADPFHNYCVALVVPSHKALEKWAHEASIKYEDLSELCNKAEAVNEVQQALSKVCHFCLHHLLEHAFDDFMCIKS